MLTIEEVKAAMPGSKKKLVTQGVVDRLNELDQSDEVGGFAQQVITHASVMQSGPWSINDYVNAVRYVGFRLMDFNKKESFTQTFPEKIKKWTLEGVTYDTIAKYISAYNKNQLVNDIYERSMIPVSVLNAGMFQDALNTQAYLMSSAKSEMVRMNAANSILTHLKPAETQKMQLEVTTRSTDDIQELQNTMSKMADQMVNAISTGSHSATEVAEMNIIAPEVIDVEVE